MKHLKGISIAIIGILSIYFCWVFYKVGFENLTTSYNSQYSNLGQYYSGSIGLILNFLTICAIVVAYFSQRKQVKLQQQEILNSKLSNDVQNFENNFYQLLNFQHTLTKDLAMKITYQNGEITVTESLQGKELIKKMLTLFRTDLSMSFAFTAFTYENFYKLFDNQYNNILGNYFRNLYHILRLIYFADYLPDKKFYSNIVRAQLSDQELTFLFFNSLSTLALYDETNDYKKPKNITFQVLIEEFNFFKYLDYDYFVGEQEDLFSTYLLKFKLEAYKGNEVIEKYYKWKINK